MSNPYDHQPVSPSPQGTLPQGSPPQGSPPQGPPAQSPWQAPPQVTKQRNGLAIAALVVAVIALLMGIGSVLSGLLGAIAFGGMAAGMDGMDGMQGTAPQVVSGQAYPGKLLQDEVTRIVGNNMGEATSVSCPATPSVNASAVTDCTGTVHGENWSFKITFEDDLGHFTLHETVD